MGIFYQIILSHTQGRIPNRSLIKSEIKPLAWTKVYYYCFNSKGDNFKVNFKMLPKTKYMSETKCLAVFLTGNQWNLK